MFVMSTRNIVIPSPDGTESVRLKRGEIGQVPAWAAKTPYFKALVADGKILASDRKRGRGTADPGTGEEAREDADGGTE